MFLREVVVGPRRYIGNDGAVLNIYVKPLTQVYCPSSFHHGYRMDVNDESVG